RATGGHTRAARREVDLPEPQAVDAPGLGPVGQLEDVPESRGLGRPVTHLLDEQANMHDVASLDRSSIVESRACPRHTRAISSVTPAVHPIRTGRVTHG